MSDRTSFQLSLAEITSCSLPNFFILVRMDLLQKRALDCSDNSIGAMGLVLLYTNIDDLQLHRGLLQGQLIPLIRENVSLTDLRSSALPHSPALALFAI